MVLSILKNVKDKPNMANKCGDCQLFQGSADEAVSVHRHLPVVAVMHQFLAEAYLNSLINIVRANNL
jgi:hypothetical protein